MRTISHCLTGASSACQRCRRLTALVSLSPLSFPPLPLPLPLVRHLARLSPAVAGSYFQQLKAAKQNEQLRQATRQSAGSRQQSHHPSHSTAATETKHATVKRIVYRNSDTGYTVLKMSPASTDTSSSSSPSSLPVPSSDGPSFLHGGDFTATGVLSEVQPGLGISLTGHWQTNDRFGPQFVFTAYTVPDQSNTAPTAAFLASALPGIGSRLAERILQHFGARTFAVLDAGGDELLAIKGITAKKLSAIRAVWTEQQRMRSVLLFFSSNHITPRQGQLLIDEYGEEQVVQRLKVNPYVVVRVPGFGFSRADAIAQQLGFPMQSAERLQGAINCALMEALGTGHVFLPEPELVKEALSMLNGREKGRGKNRTVVNVGVEAVTADMVAQQLQRMVDESSLVRENVAGYNRQWQTPTIAGVDSTASVADTAPLAAAASRGNPLGPPVVGYFSKRAWQLEHQAVRHIERLTSPTAQNERSTFLSSRGITAEYVSSWLAAYEQRQSITLTTDQRRAVLSCLLSPLSIITGIPGSGKTFILRCVTQFWAEHSITYLLTSPTGRGANRMEESTGRQAMTCHRALRWVTRDTFIEEGGGGEQGRQEWRKHKLGMELMGESTGSFMQHEGNPLSQHAYVIDEVSMIDLPLLTAYLAALPMPSSLIMVGDPDQLPSVGAGNVLRDLIGSGCVNVLRLTQPLRQGSRSLLNENVRAVNAGRMPALETIDPANVTSLPSPLAAQGLFIREEADPLPTLRFVIDKLLPSLGLKSRTDLQILSPVKRGSFGTAALNQHLRQLLNPPAASVPSITHLDELYRQGDRVMQRRNDYNKEVYNGDIGTVTHVDTYAAAITVRYPHSIVTYTADELSALLPAYAITCHKSQGSEYPAVVLYCSTQHSIMLYRSLLYTAISRAKQVLLVVGRKDALARGVWKKEERLRYSGLRLRLRRKLGLPLDVGLLAKDSWSGKGASGGKKAKGTDSDEVKDAVVVGLDEAGGGDGQEGEIAEQMHHTLDAWEQRLDRRATATSSATRRQSNSVPNKQAINVNQRR